VTAGKGKITVAELDGAVKALQEAHGIPGPYVIKAPDCRQGMPLSEYRALLASKKLRGNHNAAHTALVKACLAWLAAHRIPAWPMNTGAATVEATEKSRRRFIRFAFPGCSDIIGVIPKGMSKGRFLAVECKTGKGELTDDQTIFRDIVLTNGGAFIVARSVDDLEVLVDMMRWKGRG
jgi:hypothetical protein